MTQDLPGTLVVLSGPSGVGKTTVAQRLIDLGGYVRSVSVTTRARRNGEVDGRDYRFISRDEFENLKQAGELVESAEVHGNWYGTPKEPLRNALRDHKAFLLVIDVHGGMQVRGKGYNSLLVFLAPPDLKELARRLANRATESNEQQTVRLKRVEMEMEQAKAIYNHIVINEDLGACVTEVHNLVLAHRQKLQRMKEQGQALYPGLEMKE
ncbi:MAG: guanylate kinase [Planctomycetes bacterium]|nr:guanylate kinase [Planctomycetota bacterium]MCW8136071.1 guanylate kinase [Planctomycetota bacterium]